MTAAQNGDIWGAAGMPGSEIRIGNGKPDKQQ